MCYDKDMQIEQLTLTQTKILRTIHDLNLKKIYPTNNGIGKILNGLIDEETYPLKNLVTFSTLLSIKGRQLSAQITHLVRRDYLKYHYANHSLIKYLEITTLGISTLLFEENNRKISYKKLEPKKANNFLYKK